MEAAFDAAAAQQQAAAPSPQDQSLLDLIGPAATAFQANGQYLGTDLSPTNNFFASEKSNGDRTGFDDFGPETDVDAVDNILSPVEKTKSAFAEGLSKAIASDGMFNPFLEHQEKAAFELDSHDLFKQTTEEFDVHRDARDETPTPPAETVHDVGGLVETGVDSDSEDEWNYFKGDSANKENENPVAKRNKKSTVSEGDTTTKEENPEDDMSQLNPDAAEFVPVSPVRTATSPMSILSCSPKKPINFDVNVPDENEFESEVRNRPSDIGPGLLTSNGHSKENDDSPDSGVIQNILNGKNIDEIPEFLPGSTPSKTANDEFHFGPNAAPFTPSRQILDQSETALSTKAVFGDESVATLGTTFNESTVESLDNVTNKESDPMSMSFYAEKGDTNPFDLNEVQLLPDNLDEFLKSDEPSKESELNETLSNRPPSDLLAEVQANNDDAIQITDLDKASVDDEKELASPIEPEKDLDDLKALSPQPTQENLLGDYLCERPESLSPRPESSNSISESKSPLPEENLCGLAKSPEPAPHVVEDLLSAPEAIKSQSPDIVEPPQSQSPGIFEVSKSPEVCEVRKSPEVCELSKSPEVCELRKTPEVSEFQQSPDVCQTIPPKSPEVCAFNPSKSPDICSFQLSKSPEILERPESKSPICDIPIAKSPDLIEQNSPVDEHKDLVEEEITSSIKDDVSSPVENITSPVYSPEPQQKIEAITEQAPVVDVIQQISEAVEQVADTVQEILPELIPTESVETTQPFEPLPMDHPLAKCVFPLPTQNGEHIEVKTENITPQFAEPEIVTPSEESKHEDIVPSAPLIEGLTEEPKPDIVQEAIEHLKAPEVVSVTAEEKKPEVKPVEEKAEKKEVKKAATAVEKKPSTVKSPAARTLAAKPSPRTTPSAPKAATPRLSTTPKAAPAKTTPSKPSSTPTAKTTAAKPSPKPKTSTTTAAPKPLERKPLLNGDVKKPATTLRKPPTETKTAAKPATAAAPKPSAAKPAPRPATAPRVSATKPPATARPATAAAAAPKPRPTTLTSRTITATKTTTTATKATTNGTTKPATSPRTALAAKPRPPTTITSTKPRVPLTKTITKTTTSPDAAKQQKDSVNKLTASRTLTSARSVTATATSKTTTTTVRRVESKMSATAGRTTVSKTSTTVMKSAAGKKPTEITRTTKTKTATTKVEKPQENGVSHTTATEEITVVNNSINESIDLQKDNSPMDNKLIVNNAPIETHATD